MSIPNDETEYDFPRHEKPPLGIMPRRNHREQRLRDIDLAIVRYLEANRMLPAAWLRERDELLLDLS